MRVVNWGILAEPHNWVVVAFAIVFWAAIATLLQPYWPGIAAAGGGNAKTQSGGIGTS